MRDVVVIGAGHNALDAACYLARAGLDVEVVERRGIVGGAVSTVERFDGYHMDVGSSAHIMVRNTATRPTASDPAFARFSRRIGRIYRCWSSTTSPMTAQPKSSATCPQATRA